MATSSSRRIGTRREESTGDVGCPILVLRRQPGARPWLRLGIRILCEGKGDEVLVSGIVCVVLGTLLAIFHQRYWRFLRRASSRRFSEALAEALINPGESSKALLFVGIGAILMGLIQIAFGLELI